jgi:serine/threonine-protein kinase
VFSAALADRQQLYLRPLNQLSAAPIAGTDGAASPFFSPDGQWIGFWSGGALRKTPVAGGPATTICETATIFGASWGSDDTIVFADVRRGLLRVSAGGGTPEVLAQTDPKKGEVKYLLPQFLPGNRAILFTVTHSPNPAWDDTQVVGQSLATGERTVLVQGGADGRYLRSGHLLFLRRGTLMGVPFDPDRLRLTGGAVALMDDVMQSGNTPSEAFDSGAGQFSVSESGSLLYLPGGIFPNPQRTLVWVDRTGTVKPLPLPPRPYLSPRVSPDGRRLVFWTQGDRNVWVHDLTRGTTARLTTEGRNARAIWTRDGTRITYGSSASGGRENIFWKPADGSGPAERLTSSEFNSSAASWAPDGQTLVFAEARPDSGYDILTLSLAADRQPRFFIQTRFNEAYSDFSPDGRWLAYASNESGRSEVYVVPYPGPGPRQQVSTDGGTAPAWSNDGQELFYTPTETVGGQATFTTMMVVTVQLKPTFSAGTPRKLFAGMFGATAAVRPYDLTPDGRQFVMVQQKERPPVSASEMILVQNWVEELKARVPVK